MNILDRLKGIIAEKQGAPFVMLEIGACDGYHTNQFLNLLKESNKPFLFDAFEPVPSNYTTCLRNLRGHEGFFNLWNMAVGSEVGTVPFYVSGGLKIVDGKVADSYYGSSSLRRPKLVTSAWPDMTFMETQTRVTTLDAFVSEHIVGDIDFIWADVQGAEVDLIRGGMKTWGRIRYLYTEYENQELYEGEIGLPEIRDLLPTFDVVEDYGGDVLLKNRRLP